ncbi:hypothetical protein KDA_57110 [Dictyobacter alpinus]|uniref:Pyrrolo-quinoline quinone repeat domain-containing protein n=1 Tax=Dictyobacter alpinus TaxID=2014873 RepID=A0A402BG33_9CHLR|nr:PQQ-binding-like beta-propeller repeat protein [Dictyobacter alpinus]GCE30227.1 hypothetical protein KDA_57110 [Dictyobacter alpinus]
MQAFSKQVWTQKRPGFLIRMLSIILMAILVGCSQPDRKPAVSASNPTPISTPTAIPALDLVHNTVSLSIMADVVYAGTQEQGVYAFNARDGKKIWQADITGIVSWQPTVADGIIYVTSSTGEGGSVYVSALRAHDGKLLWRYHSDMNMNLAGVENGMVYLSTLAQVVALRATDGIEVWHVDNSADQALLVEKDVVYLNQVSSFSALNARNGVVLWTHQLADRTDVLKSSNGTVYICCDKGKFAALSARDGRVQWSQTIDATMALTPQIVNGIVYLQATKINLGDSTTPTASTSFLPLFASTGNMLKGARQTQSALPLKQGQTSLYALRANDGKVLWKQMGKSGNDGFANWFQVEQGIVYSMTTTSTPTSTTSTLVALQSESGQPLWQQTNKIAATPYSACIRDGVIYRLGAQTVDALSARDGKPRWSYQLAGNAYDLPIASAQNLYVGTDNGLVYALNPKNGQLQWRYNTHSHA